MVAYLRARDERWTTHWQEAIARQRHATGRLLAVFDALKTWRPSQDQPRGCAFADAFVELADDLLLIYRGVLTSMMLEPVEMAVERGRGLAQLRLQHG